MLSVCVLCRLFGFNEHLTASLIPKSVTTPIAIEISSQLSGIPSITVAAVVITGILGAVISPLLIKMFKVKDPAAAGVSIGTCSHAVGTSKVYNPQSVFILWDELSYGIKNPAQKNLRGVFFLVSFIAQSFFKRLNRAVHHQFFRKINF